MAKSEFSINIINKEECKDILSKYHYLSSISKGFKSGVNFGLVQNGNIVGVCIFTGFPVPELVKSIFGLDRNNQEGMFELSRLCLCPSVQSSEINITSWFVSKCIKTLRKTRKVSAILSYADSDFHSGVIYRALNFKYYGLSAPKKDFYVELDNGEFSKLSRGKTKGIKGEWRDRSRKHRFLLVFDKKLNVLWDEVKKGAFAPLLLC